MVVVFMSANGTGTSMVTTPPSGYSLLPTCSNWSNGGSSAGRDSKALTLIGEIVGYFKALFVLA